MTTNQEIMQIKEHSHKPLEVIKTHDGRYVHISNVEEIYSALPMNEAGCMAKLKINLADMNNNGVDAFSIMYFKLYNGDFVATVTTDQYYYETLQSPQYYVDQHACLQLIYSPLPINVEQSVILGWLKYFQPNNKRSKKST